MNYYLCALIQVFISSGFKENFRTTFHFNRETLIAPFAFLGQLRSYDVKATVDGGFAGNWSMLNGRVNKYRGCYKSAMAGAIRLAISKALLAFVNEEQSEQMRRGEVKIRLAMNYSARLKIFA